MRKNKKALPDWAKNLTLHWRCGAHSDEILLESKFFTVAKIWREDSEYTAIFEGPYDETSVRSAAKAEKWVIKKIESLIKSLESSLRLIVLESRAKRC